MMLLFDFIQIGNKLFAIRKKAGLTQDEVAERAGLSIRTYADLERGSVNIRMETLLKICKVLGITPDEILTEGDPSAAPDEQALLSRLSQCNPKERSTALRLLSVYLESLE